MPSPLRFSQSSRIGPSSSEGRRPGLLSWRRKGATAVAGALAIAMGYGVVFGHNGLTAFEQKRQEERRLREQTLQLQQENSRLRGHVERLKSDPGAIEHQAREELHYTRPGEVIYSLESEPASKGNAVAQR